MPTAFDGSPYAPIPFVINKAASGNATLITGVTGQKCRVYGLRLSVAGAVIVQILDNSTVLEVFNFAGAGGSVVLDMRQQPYYTGTAGQNFRINLSAAVQVDGQLEYTLAP